RKVHIKGRIINTTWDFKFNKLLQGLWKHNLICQTIEEALEHQISFKPKSIKWELILQDNKTLATWSQLKLLKVQQAKERNQFDLKGLAIPNLQSLSVYKRIKDWVITKKMDREHTLGYIVKKNSNSVLIEHWKELDHLVLSQSKLEKCRKCTLSIDPTQDTCTLRLSKNKIQGTLQKTVPFLRQHQMKQRIHLWKQHGSKSTKMKPKSLNKVCIEPETGIFNKAGITSNFNGPLHDSGKKD
ncbi:3095_t:CDS:2, partial [Gigaspora rosea]